MSSKPEHPESADIPKKPGFLKRYPLLTFSVILGLVMIGGSLAFAAKVKHADGGQSDFDPKSVLPQSITPPAASADQVFTAETIKQYDGKNGHKCYAAVDGVVYEIPQTGQWQNGQHSPSNGEAYCGADLSQAIQHSPHGKSKLQELAKVGTFK